MNWIELKALNELYEKGCVKTNKTLHESAEIRFLINSLQLIHEEFKEFRILDGFTNYYEKKYLSDFNKYSEFLKENELLKPQTRFDLNDIEILFTLQNGIKDGSLQYLKNQIIQSDESLRGVSLMFFKNEKYLLKREALSEALKKILGVASFANEKDKQYIYKLECHDPRVIILCENLDFLTKPDKPRKYGLELWYAGGKNIPKLKYSDPRGLPIYYSCDWDYDGLLIYTWIKELIPPIVLLYPNGSPRSILDTEHQSIWQQSINTLGGLPEDFFSEKEKQLIQQLVSEEKWVIEESNDLITMLSEQKLPFAV